MFHSSCKKSVVTQWASTSICLKKQIHEIQIQKSGFIFWEVSFLESKSQRKLDIRVVWKPVNINNNEKSFYPTTKLNLKV